MVLVGMPAMGVELRIDNRAFVESSRRIIGTNYGSTEPAHDFPAIASDYLAGELPLDVLVEQVISLEQVPDAQASLRRGSGLRRVVVHDPVAHSSIV